MNDLALAWRLARRELRGGLEGFRVLIGALALGVAAIAGVGSLGEAVVAGLRADSRALLGGDIDLRLHNRPAGEDQLAYLRERSAALSTVTEMRAMARPAGGRQVHSLVEMKAVDGAYPLAGSVVLEPAMPLAAALARRDGAWGAAIDANLLDRLGIGPGDRLRVGDAVFEARAVVAGEPDRVATILSLGPRMLVAADALAATGLVLPGSQIHFNYRIALPPGTAAGPWIEALEAAFPKAGWRIRGVDEAAPGVRDFIARMTLFMTFVGLTTLLVGGIGVGNAVHGYLEERWETIATLKCLGAPGGLVFRTYLLQVLTLALGGIGIGLAAGAGLPAVALSLLEGSLPVAPRIGLYPAPLLLAAVFGLLVALTFALWPLGRAREISAANLFRGRAAAAVGRPRPAIVAATVAGVLGLSALTVLGVSDRVFAAWFVGGALATLLALRAGAGLLMAGAARAGHRQSATAGGAEWRLVLANLHRPGASTPGVMLSLGLGISVLVAIALIEGNLGRQIDQRLPETAPAFFFIDIQSAQVEAFDAALAAVPEASGLRRVPTLRGRIVRIDGVPVEEAEIGADSAWAVRGDRALTYAAEPSAESRIVAGEWWPRDYRGPPLISLDAAIARDFGVGLGDTLTLNVLGREIEATIASLREIDWRTLRFDFAIIFAPGTLEGAPHTHIAAVHAPPSAEEKVERAITGRFANITAIRVRDALETAARILAGVGTAVRGTAALAIAAGALVLGGAIAATRRRRIYDSVIFKVLGATRGAVLRIFLIEYGVLGAATGIVAAGVGTATAWAVVVFLMDMEWVFLPGVVAVTVAASMALTMVVGFAGTWRALGDKAAPYLRNE